MGEGGKIYKKKKKKKRRRGGKLLVLRGIAFGRSRQGRWDGNGVVLVRKFRLGGGVSRGVD